MKMAEMAEKHESDLLMLHDVYKMWLESSCGCTDKNKAAKLRAAYASKEGLNNRVLAGLTHTVESTLGAIRKVVKCNTPTAGSAVDELSVIGKCLLSSFPEQVGVLLIPSDPSLGAFLVANRDLKGRMSSTSVVMQQAGRENGGAFITMKSTVIPSGVLMIDYVHPVDTTWLHQDLAAELSSLDMTCCWSGSNLPRWCPLKGAPSVAV